MDHKLKKTMVPNFKTMNPQIAYLCLASEAFIRNTSAVIRTTTGLKISKDIRGSWNLNLVKPDSAFTRISTYIYFQC